MFVKKEDIQMLRKRYPKGTRVKLVKMDDPQAPPIGILGTVTEVDDIGSIMVSWDSSSGFIVSDDFWVNTENCF